MTDKAIVLALIGTISTVITALIVNWRETAKLVNERERQVDDKISAELNLLDGKNKKLSGDMEELAGAIRVLKINYITLSREYAIVRAEVKILSDISEKLIAQIKSAGLVPVITKKEAEDLISIAKHSQGNTCHACIAAIEDESMAIQTSPLTRSKL